MKKCPFCSAEIENDIKNCDYCRRELPGEDQKICPDCGKVIPAIATKCKYCDHSFLKPVIRKPYDQIQKERQEYLTGKKSWIWIVAIIILVFSCFAFLERDDSSKTATPYAGDNEGAWVACRNLVKSELLSPSSAKFQGYGEVMINKSDQNRYSMLIKVDSKNVYGVMINNTFYCQVEYKSGDWQKVSLVIH